ncbi:hypothetical protein AWRI796_5157 [Saccharomyces cerevisiae AWRI796]|nr:hypothetical protein AWRI796_5157 [Saccharomyces cerevisiae AWRI796]
MDSDMRCKATLCNIAILIWGHDSPYTVNRTILLIVTLTAITFKAGQNLSTNTNTISHLDAGVALWPYLNNMANHFMAKNFIFRNWAPITGCYMEIRPTDTTSFDFNINIVVSKWFWVETHQCGVFPIFWVGNTNTFKLFWIGLFFFCFFFLQILRSTLKLRCVLHSIFVMIRQSYFNTVTGITSQLRYITHHTH